MVDLASDLAFRRVRAFALAAILAVLAFRSAHILASVQYQRPGVDFSCFWAGAKAALASPERLYDFRYISGLQGWPLGPDAIRPYIYPPSALFLFIPFTLPPYWWGFAAWVAVTGGLYLWAARRAGAPWWIALMPAVVLVALCGQITFLIGGLVLAGLALKDRPVLAGVLFGVAAAVKPQLLVFVPVALAAEGRWRTTLAAGVTGAALCAAAAAIWGLDLWWEWLAAVQRFQTEVILTHRGLVEDGITPASQLALRGVSTHWSLLLTPFSLWLVWTTFRRTQALPDRLIAIFAAPLLISPYAMNYEAALLAPAVAAYMARTDDRMWPAYAVAGYAWAWGLVYGPAPILAALCLPLAAWIGGRLRPSA